LTLKIGGPVIPGRFFLRAGKRILILRIVPRDFVAAAF
jgi:hypothetical protein